MAVAARNRSYRSARELASSLVALTLICGLACRPGGPARPAPETVHGKIASDFAATEPEPHALDNTEPRTRPAPSPATSRDQALLAVVSGNPEGAAAFLERHITSHPTDDEGRAALARALMATGEYDRAEQILLESKREHVDLLRLRVHLHGLRGELGAAEKLLERMHRQNPASLAVRGELLWIRVHTGRGGDATSRELMEGIYDDYDAGRAKTAEDLLAVARAALARGTTGAFHDGNQVLAEAEQKTPIAQGTWIGDEVRLLRAAVFLEKYDGQTAADLLQALLQRDSWHPEALTAMARVHLDALQFSSAARLAREALRVNPRHAGAHSILARIALIEGRREEARERVERSVLTVNPVHVEGLAVAAALALVENEPDRFAHRRQEALTANPRNGEFYRVLADLLGFLHLYRQAGEVLEEAASLVPDDPVVQAALALNLLRIGDEDRGRQALGRAWKRDRFNRRTDNLIRLYDERIGQHYTHVERGDVTYRLPTADHELVLARLEDAVERARKALDQRYGMRPSPLRLEFFADPDEFSIRTIGVPSLGALAVCFGHLVTFIGPYDGRHNLDAVVWHELAHVYAIDKSDGRVPRWFTEGLSEWESELADGSWARESAGLLAEAKRRGKVRRLSELELAFIRAESPAMMEVAYSTAAYAVRWLGESHGRPKLIAMLEGYATGATTEDLVERHLGKSMAVLDREFEAWLTAELAQRITGWEPSLSPGVAAKDERDRRLADAVEALERKDLTAAATALDRLVTNGGDGYRPRLLLGRIRLEQGNHNLARKHLEKARSFHREEIDPLVLLTRIDRELGDVDGEKRWLAEALAIDSESLDPAARLLMLAIVTDDQKAATVAGRRASAIAPLHPMVLASQAWVLANSGKKDRGLTHLRRALQALERGSGPSETFVVAAIAADAAGDPATAKILATRALQDETLPSAAKRRLEAVRHP